MVNSESILENIVKIVKEEKNGNIGFSKICSYLSKNFPELLESEDERIRKNCIHFLELQKSHHAATFEIEECITWLEKQSKHEQKLDNLDVLPGLYKCVHRMFDGTSEGRLLFEVGNVYRCLSKHDNRAEFEVSHGHSICLEDSIVRKHFVPVEKQNYESQSIAESRPAKLPDGIEFPFKAKVKKNNEIVVITNGQLDDTQPKDSRSYIAYTSDITDGYKVYKPEELEFIKQPGFKIGDWVVNKLGKAWHIDSSYGKNYQVSDGKGNYSYFPISKQDEMHLWSIEDAKGGDVLVDKSDGTIGIFQSIGHHPDGGSFNDPSYCYLHCRYDDEFFYADFENGNTMDSNDAIPATKQQCDLLFQKMKEAGYSWDGKLKKSTKFSKGDWIYRGTGDPYLVESVFKEQYELCSGFGYHFNKGIDEIDSDYRLWNINDAKFGDILADDNTIAIYEEQSTKTFFHVLCYYCKKTFVPKKGTLAVLGFHPVTKEQRELFSNELKKSGYNLDLEKKQLTDQPELTKFEQSLKHIIEEALDDGGTHNLKADAELLLSVANQDRVKIELTKEEEDALEQAIISLEDMFDSDQPETCYAGHHVPFDVAAKCLSNLKDKILNSK